MKHIEDTGYWDMWKSLTLKQRYMVKDDWARGGHKKERLATELWDLYEYNYELYLEELANNYEDDDHEYLN